MSQPLDEDYYNVSDTSGDEAGWNVEDISDIIQNIDLDAIRTQLLNQPSDPSPMNYMKDRQGRFNKYIPLWINPTLNSYPRRHPALRPDDVWEVDGEHKFPSDYAKRFGADKRAPPDDPGRSMLSPNNQDPSLDWTEDFQAVVFRGYTADELKFAQGAFDPQMSIDGSLDGLTSNTLHPLVRRGNWVQAANEGNSFENSILWYNYTGQDRRWDAAANDEVWQALQPVLQLISKVLYSNHPFWRSIHDICKISPIDKSRIPVPPPDRQVNVLPDQLLSNMSTLHYHLDDQYMYPEAKALRDSGFDSIRVVEQILRSCLTFRFGDTVGHGAYAHTSVSLIPAQAQIILTITPENVWPLMLPTYSKSEKFVAATTLASIILHELAHCARDAIAIMTELDGWQRNPALVTPRPDDDGPVPIDLSQLPQNHLDLLLQLGNKIGGIRHGIRFPQFFFENEFRSEEGWAFENQLWGGVAVTLPELGSKEGWPQVISWLQPWPYPMETPRPYFRDDKQLYGEVDPPGWPNWLLDPPPTMVRRQTALSVTMMSRLYDEAFWSADFGRYGHSALKFPVHEWQGQHLRSSFLFNFIPAEILQRAFLSSAAWPWLGRALTVLATAGEEALSEYVYQRTIVAAGPDVVRRRLHYERKRWRTADDAVNVAAGEVARLRGEAAARLAEYTGGGWDGRVERLGTYLDQAGLVAAAAHDVSRLLGWEISALQFGVSECARVEPGQRSRVRRFLDSAGSRIDRAFKTVLDGAIPAVAEVSLQMNLMLGPLPAAPAPGGAGERRRRIEARLHAAHEVLGSTRVIVDELGQNVDALRASYTDPAQQQGGGQGQAAQQHPHAFSLLAERSSDRLRRISVERLALHRLRGLPQNSPLVVIVSACSRILARC